MMKKIIAVCLIIIIILGLGAIKMGERNYYVICDDNCRFEGMTKEQIIEAIAEATGATPTQIDEAFITKIKEQNHNSALKIWIGTEAEYNAIIETASDTLYFITDSAQTRELETNIEVLQRQVIELQQQISQMHEKQGKLLWSGSAVAGDTIIVPNINDYKVFMIEPSGSANVIIAGRTGTHIVGTGVQAMTAQHNSYDCTLIVTGDSVKVHKAFKVMHISANNHSEVDESVAIEAIYGII